jgi:hypothetical protein
MIVSFKWVFLPLRIGLAIDYIDNFVVSVPESVKRKEPVALNNIQLDAVLSLRDVVMYLMRRWRILPKYETW